MAQYAFVYIGGEVPEKLREKNMKEWYAWMEKLGGTGKLVQAGAPFGSGGKVLTAGGSPKAYDWKKNSNVTGYTIVEAKDLDEAVSLTKNCPQLAPEYGKGVLEVRDVIPM